MNRIFVSALTYGVLACSMLAAPLQAQWRAPRGYPPASWQSRPLAQGVPNLNGIWYLTGNPRAVCEIHQFWPQPRAVFINEHGSRAEGTVTGNHVWIPAWGPDGQGQEGTIVGGRIVWPDGNFWSRAAF